MAGDRTDQGFVAPLSGSASLTYERLCTHVHRLGRLAELAVSSTAGRVLCLIHTRQIERQLAARSDAVWSVWTTSGFDVEFAKELCGSIQEISGWTQPWFVPGDSLALVLDLSFDFLGLVELQLDCEDRFGVRIEPDSLRESLTIGDVAQRLVAFVEGASADGGPLDRE